MIELNGVAHIALSVSQWEACRAFYEKLLAFAGMTCVFEGEDHIYYIGGRTAVLVARCDAAHEPVRFVQGSVGLHHVCFRCRSMADVDAVHELLKSLEAKIVHAPEKGPWAPGYYSVLCEDPCGIRLEFNHVPGKGVFEEGVRFNPGGDYR